MKMTSIKIVSLVNARRKEFPVEKWFKASESPLYVALITKPSPGLWEFLSQSKEVVMELDGKSYNFRIPYRIEVGESTIFFATPSDESSSPVLNQ